MKEVFIKYSSLPMLIDEEDFERINKYFWFLKHNIISANVNNQLISVGQFLIGKKEEYIVDHKDRNFLNCQKNNLRHITQDQNQWNSKIPHNNTSGYKGVYYNKEKQMFQVQIMYHGIAKYLGRYFSIREAVIVYNKAAKRYHGQYAVLNTIPE